MNVLLVNPKFPVTYWGFQHALPFTRARAVLPPLGLITLAAQLPDAWRLRLLDLNVLGPERSITSRLDRAIRWADAVFVGGMRVQAPSILRVVRQARGLGVTTVVGGPAPTTSPGEFAEADIIFQGEAEGRIDELVAALEAPRGAIRLLPNDGDAPEMTTSPIPRFDLLELRHYDTMSVQYSRGCPYRCEFCDIIEIYGRRPRVKAAEQVIEELDTLRRLGWRGALFVVDDNFIGNRPAVHKLLPRVADFQRRHGFPFELTTEASVNLASDDKLVTAMVEAGFQKVFLGIESPDPKALAGTQKTQNLRLDLLEAVGTLTAAGLEVMAGFIVGFDQDTPETFEAQRAFIQASHIPLAMAGLLLALPGTQLWRRLTREGRLRDVGSGDQFARPNFVPTLDEEVLLEGYATLLAQLYDPAAYYERCAAFARRAGKVPCGSGIRPADLLRLVQVIAVLGVRRPYRRHFWRLLFGTLRHAPYNLKRALVQAVIGEHLIRYTREYVVPMLENALTQVRAEKRAAELAATSERRSPFRAHASATSTRQLASTSDVV